MGNKIQMYYNVLRRNNLRPRNHSFISISSANPLVTWYPFSPLPTIQTHVYTYVHNIIPFHLGTATQYSPTKHFVYKEL